MTKKVFEDNVQEEQMETSPAVKQMIRWVGPITGPQTDAIGDVDKELDGWISNGYKLFAAHYLQTDSTINAHLMMYILVKQ